MKEQLEENLDIERDVRREQRIRAMRRRKEQQDMVRRWLRIAIPAAGVFIIAIILIVKAIGKPASPEGGEQQRTEMDGTENDTLEIANSGNGGTGGEGIDSTAGNGEAGGAGTDTPGADNAYKGSTDADDTTIDGTGEAKGGNEAFRETGNTRRLGGNIVSNYAILIDLDKGSIVAEKNGKVRMNPASMTKVLTLLVAAEHIDNLEQPVTITQEMTDYSFANGCSSAGFERDETVTVKDLLYGTILPSGAEAAVGLAIHVSGSQEAFVDLMNEKLEELGLSESAHFTNCVGVYDDDHYCTPYDMAVIMGAALENDLCRQVLSAKTYTTSETEEHPEGMILSNWFLRRIEDKDVGDNVKSGKTGYVEESGSCAVSYGENKDGKRYICVTADAQNQWRCIDDHAEIYRQVM
ncbi:MAG: D-alanyl-D-alanine carboxypeptidase [Lachnospiraceae bacterium]|jgi:D-alanyl-D-alanine carboxypeptidase (penicillin-binding protein 5/6)|nr:D-alanyl-D-alanine carboxypeptidase [Lachnospiraceae bacterium]